MLRTSIFMSIILSMPALVDVCGAENPMIQNETLRIQTEKHGDRVTLRFDARTPGKPWRTVLSNVAISKNRPWETGPRTSIEDIEGGPFFTKAAAEAKGLFFCRPHVYYCTERESRSVAPLFCH